MRNHAATSRARRSRGMTLIEVLISLLLGTVGLLGMLVLVLSLATGSNFSRQLTEASVLGQSKLEELVSMTGVTLTSPANGIYPATPEQIDAYGRPNAGGAYTRTWEYTTPPADAAGTRRRITVRVTWNDARGNPHTMTQSRDKVPQ